MLNKAAKFDLVCPNCKKTVVIRVGQVLDGDIIVCPACKLRFEAKELQDNLKNIEAQLKDFATKTKRFNS